MVVEVDSWVVVDSLVVDVGRVVEVVVVGASVVLVEVEVDVDVVLVLVLVEVDDVVLDEVVVLDAVVVVVDRASVVVVDPPSVVVVVDGNVGSVGPSPELHAVTSKASTTDATNAAWRRFQPCDRGILGLPAASTKPPPWLTQTPRRRNRAVEPAPNGTPGADRLPSTDECPRFKEVCTAADPVWTQTASPTAGPGWRDRGRHLMAEWQRARVIPVSGISSEREAEVRATSALLAVIEAVRDLSTAMFSPFGASRAQRAEVRCFTEVPFKLGPEKTATRPDGLVEIKFGKSIWTALVEVKTGSATLSAEQVNAYWDVAREQGYDAVITISNEIGLSKETHPTDGLKVRSNSKVQVHHYSWTQLLSMCEVIKDHHGVDDPDQAWILNELIRYLRHPNSGATAFDDMGAEWVSVRDGARDASLRKSDASVRDIAKRWDQLLRFAALRLEAKIGQPVSQQLPAAQREAGKRLQHLIDELAGSGRLDGVLRIPNTVGDIEVCVDLRARRITTAIAFAAPDDRGGRARCTWLAGQLDTDVDPRLVIESYAKNARTPIAATLVAVRENKDVLLGPDKKDPTRFRLSLTREMGLARKGGRKTAGFIDSILSLITDFYGTVIQDLSPWTPKAPKMSQPTPAAEPDPGSAHHTEPVSPSEVPYDPPDKRIASPFEVPASTPTPSLVPSWASHMALSTSYGDRRG